MVKFKIPSFKIKHHSKLIFRLTSLDFYNTFTILFKKCLQFITEDQKAKVSIEKFFIFSTCNSFWNLVAKLTFHLYETQYFEL